ncbi:unnamed protein product [Heligmosomoides polygyrus]|uniref:Uncharacterized protein n=1 Tax=Heligmosomoides polygyrus TaxID=6339 RepID=A0A183GPY9_HELPZ|nr:unnamed protein product [Heligmosomoides polygyrus]
MGASVKDGNPKTGAASFTSTDDAAVNSFNEMMGKKGKQSAAVPLCAKRHWKEAERRKSIVVSGILELKNAVSKIVLCMISIVLEEF